MTNPRSRHGLEVVGVVHAHWKRGTAGERFAHHGIFVGTHTTHHRAELLLHGARW